MLIADTADLDDFRLELPGQLKGLPTRQFLSALQLSGPCKNSIGKVFILIHLCFSSLYLLSLGSTLIDSGPAGYAPFDISPGKKIKTPCSSVRLGY